MKRRIYTLVPLLLVALLTSPWIRVGVARGEDPPGAGPGRSHAYGPHHRHGSDPRLDYFYRLHAPNVPSQAGQDTLGAIQETVGRLLADPATDWSTISITRLRGYLVDLDEIVKHAAVEERPVDGGVAITVGGEDATLAALHRVLPVHLAGLDGFRDWRIETRETAAGTEIVLTTEDPAEVEVVRALGFYGFLSVGPHPSERHLAIARGLTPSPS